MNNNLDTTVITATNFYQKPHEVDEEILSPVTISPKYEKPHAYDEDPPMVITASRHGSRSSRMTTDSFSSRYFQRKGPTAIIADFCTESSSQQNIKNITTTATGECYSPNTPIESPPLSPKPPTTIMKKENNAYSSQADYQHITSFILSQPTPTTQTSCHHHEDENNTLPSYYVLPSSPANSITGFDTSTIKNNAASNNVAAATAALLSNDSGIISSFFLNPSKRKTSNVFMMKGNNNTSNNNVVVYCFKKSSLLKPNQHHIFLHIDHPDEEDDEEIMVYRKIQPYSYTWGLHSMLYCNKNDGQGFKVAEARRRAFQKDIFIESADYDNSEINDITQAHINNIKNISATTNINCQNLIKKSQSNLLFEYEIWFHGSRMRWKRPSLLSHDFTCEIKLTRQETKLYLLQQQQEQQKKKKSTITKQQKNKKMKSAIMNGYPDTSITTSDGGFIDSDSDNDEDDHDNHSHKTCRRWKLLAEFHSHKLSYLNKELGKLSIDLDILNQVEKDRCDLLEANIVMTCSTLIDLIRDVMGKQ